MFASSTDESDDKEEGREMMRDGSESWEWFMHGWRRVSSGAGWEEVQGLLCEVLVFVQCNSISFFRNYALSIQQLSLTCQITFLFLLLGFGFATMGENAKGGGTLVRDRRPGQDSIGCGRIGGRGFVWALVGSHATFPHALCPSPTQNAANLQLSPSPCHPTRVPRSCTWSSCSCYKKSELAPEVPTPAAPEALDVAIPTHMTPLHLELGGIKRVYKCQVEVCTEGPSTSHGAICTHVYRDHLGVRLAYPLVTKPSSIQTPSGITGKVTLLSKLSIH